MSHGNFCVPNTLFVGSRVSVDSNEYSTGGNTSLGLTALSYNMREANMFNSDPSIGYS